MFQGENQLLKICIVVYKNKWSCASRTRDMQAHRLNQYPLRCRDKKQILMTEPVSKLVDIAMLWRTVLRCNSPGFSRTLKLTSNYLYVLEPSDKKHVFPIHMKEKTFSQNVQHFYWYFHVQFSFIHLYAIHVKM